MKSSERTKAQWGLDPGSLRKLLRASHLSAQGMPDKYCLEMAEKEHESWERFTAEHVIASLQRVSDPEIDVGRVHRAGQGFVPDGYFSDAFVYSAIASLRSEIAQLREERQRELAELRDQVQKISRKLDEVLPSAETDLGAPTSDPIAEWLATHPEEVVKYRGQQIAVHPTEGIIASGSNFRAVYEEVQRRGYDVNSVVFDGVDINYGIKK